MLENYTHEIDKIRKSIKHILNSILKANEIFLIAVKKCDIQKFDEAKSYLKNISSKIESIDNEIIKILALYTPEARDLREVVAYFKIDNELLRVVSNSRKLIKGFKDNCFVLDESIVNEYVMPLQISTVRTIENSIKMIGLDNSDELKDIYHAVMVEEDKTDELYMLLEKKIFESLKNINDFAKIHNILRVFRRSEKIADRTMSIANLLLYIQEGGTLKRI